ncbi:MAG: glycosyltransferase [Candidatus Limnocylindria bacterium]
MHVAFLTDVALPYVSGVTVAVRAQADALIAAGTTVTVVGPRGDVDLPQPDAQVPGAPRGYRVALFSPRLPASLRARGVGLVHAHSVFGASWAALSAARALRVPLVVTVHTRFDEYAHYTKAVAPLARALLTPYVGAVTASADVVIAPSRAFAEELAEMHLPRSLRVVPAPVAEALAGGDAARGRAALDVGRSVPLVLSVSRLAREKRVLDLVEMLAASRHRDAVLAFAGQGPLDVKIAAVAERAGVSARIRMAGQLEPAALADALAAADIVASASRSETQGLALCEAAAAGRAIVAPDRGGYAEVLRHGEGGMFPGAAPSARELAECLDALLDDAARRGAMAALARERARAWTPHAVAEGLFAAYAEAALMRE